MPENEVWINDDVAARLGFKNGDRVWLENQDGAHSGPIQVKATQRIRKDCVYMVHGFGHDAPGMTRAHGRGPATPPCRRAMPSIRSAAAQGCGSTS